jgi:hypothetical protein
VEKPFALHGQEVFGVGRKGLMKNTTWEAEPVRLEAQRLSVWSRSRRRHQEIGDGEYGDLAHRVEPLVAWGLVDGHPSVYP